MARFIDKKTNWSKVVAVALAGASLSAPAFMATSAQAAPSLADIADVLRIDRNRDGYDDRDIDRDGDIDRDIDRDGDIDFNDVASDPTDTTTRTGIVTQDLNGDRFQIRADNGETFIVNLRGNGPTSLREGSRVRVTGLRNGNRITRATVQVLNSGSGYGNYGNYGNGNYGNGSTAFRTFRGRVTRDTSGRRFEMVSQGTTFYVNLRGAEPNNLSEGDVVEVSGRLTGNNTIDAGRVRILSNSGYGNGGYNNGNTVNVDFSGRVTDVQSQRRFTVRGDNGTIYDVRSDSDINSRISSGDRVRVQGTVRGGNRVVRATRVQLRNDNGNNGNNGRLWITPASSAVSPAAPILVVGLPFSKPTMVAPCAS